MIKVYEDGSSFYLDNKDFLLTNIHTEVFFRFDAPLLKKANKDEYALKVYNDKSRLVALLKEPFNILLYGDSSLAGELIDFLINNQYKIKGYLAPTELGEAFMAELGKRNIKSHLDLGMDFMEARVKLLPSSEEVEVAKEDDVDEILNMAVSFFNDCGLSDEVTKEKILKAIDGFRIIREDGKIVSMAKMSASSSEDMRISFVYTRNEYRGKGYAKKICTNIVNEIIDKGFYATLNVDKKNPISNHIYSSIGFKKTFSQGVFLIDEK